MATYSLAVDAQKLCSLTVTDGTEVGLLQGRCSTTRATHFEKSRAASGFDWRHHWKAVDRGDGKEDGDGKIKRVASLPELRS